MLASSRRRVALLSGRNSGFGGVCAVLAVTATLCGCSKNGDFFATDPEHRSLKFSDTTGGEAGGTVTVYANQSFGSVRPFFRTGISGDFSNDRSASFQNVSIPKASGTATLSQSWSVPVLAGVAFPTSDIGLNIPKLTAQIYGGAEISGRKAKVNLTEGLAPAGAATSASDSWTSVDPAIGGALLYEVSRWAGQPINIGPSVTVAWMGSHSFAAPSANFPTETYIVSTGNRTDTRVMLNLNFGISPTTEVGLAGGAVW
ncbi:MAG TPA: hypothetical protein VFA57_07205 [Pseudolabrys sp.]|nr:hypothetical protein [Pseudolabrys sp.]